MKLLISHDGTECADAAIDDLRRAGLPDSGEAMILSVAEVWAYTKSVDGRVHGMRTPQNRHKGYW